MGMNGMAMGMMPQMTGYPSGYMGQNPYGYR